MKNICILILYFAEIVSWCVWFTHHWRWSTNKIFKALCMFPSENKEVVPVALVHLTEGYTLSMTIFHLRLESLCTVVLPLTCALLNPEIIGIVWSLLISHVCAEMTLSGDNLPSDMLLCKHCSIVLFNHWALDKAPIKKCSSPKNPKQKCSPNPKTPIWGIQTGHHHWTVSHSSNLWCDITLNNPISDSPKQFTEAVNCLY